MAVKSKQVKEPAHAKGTSKATLASAGVQADMLGTINARIDAIMAAEKITKKELGLVSREILEYITLNGSPDVATLNRLIAVLTPKNKDVALIFFKEFVPHQLEEGTFTKRHKGEKKLQSYVDKVKEFLDNPDNDIWVWAEANIQVERVPTPFETRIASVVRKSMEGDEAKGLAPLSVKDVLHAVMTVDGVDIDNVMEAIADLDLIEIEAPVAA